MSQVSCTASHPKAPWVGRRPGPLTRALQQLSSRAKGGGLKKAYLFIRAARDLSSVGEVADPIADDPKEKRRMYPVLRSATTWPVTNLAPAYFNSPRARRRRVGPRRARAAAGDRQHRCACTCGRCTPAGCSSWGSGRTGLEPSRQGQPLSRGSGEAVSSLQAALRPLCSIAAAFPTFARVPATRRRSNRWRGVLPAGDPDRAFDLQAGRPYAAVTAYNEGRRGDSEVMRPHPALVLGPDRRAKAGGATLAYGLSDRRPAPKPRGA